MENPKYGWCVVENAKRNFEVKILNLSARKKQNPNWSIQISFQGSTNRIFSMGQ